MFRKDKLITDNPLNKQIVIGHTSYGYPLKRNIIGIVPDAKYKLVRNILQNINGIIRRINRLLKNDKIIIDRFTGEFKDFNLNNVSVLHLFNLISRDKTPWVVTFETILPRYKSMLQIHMGNEPRFSHLKKNSKIDKALRLMAGNSCKKIIAMSQCNANMQKELLKEFPEYKEQIQEKMIVLYPPQRLFVNSFYDKGVELDGQINFMFVGNLFIRKGGMEILEILSELKEEKRFNFKLTIVSSLKTVKDTLQEDSQNIEVAKSLIKNNRSWIEYFSNITNEATLELMKTAHVGLLPTYADTFGFSVLEFQANGCPVITTNVRALSEINDNNKGWVIEIPKNYLGEGIYTTKNEMFKISRLIKKGIKSAVYEIFSDRSIISKKSNSAISNIRENHSPVKYAEKLKNIYIETT